MWKEIIFSFKTRAGSLESWKWITVQPEDDKDVILLSRGGVNHTVEFPWMGLESSI